MSEYRIFLCQVIFTFCLPATAFPQTAVQGRDSLPTDIASCLSKATQARTKNNIEDEQRLLEHAETLTGTDSEVAQVQKRLALIDWRHHQRHDAARERLKRAGNGPDPTMAWFTLTELELTARNYEAAAKAAAQAKKTADSEFLRVHAKLAINKTAVRAAMDRRRQGKLAADTSLLEIMNDLRETVSSESGHLETSRVLLQAALLLDDGDAALLGWRSYFHVVPGSPMPNAIAKAGNIIQNILPDWSEAEATVDTRIRLIHALGESRLFAEAELVALDPRADERVRENPRVIELMAYARIVRKLREEVDDFYRLLSLRKTHPSKLDQLLNRAWNELWPDLHEPGSKTAPRGKKLTQILATRFGTDFTVGETGGFYSLHMGHIVIDETRSVTQYGYSGDMRFVSLDNMVSNGFWTWMRGANSTGGWAKPGAMWQVRPAYASEPLNVWRELHSEKEVARFEKEIIAENARDDARARENPHAYLPGLNKRLTKQALFRILDELKKKGFEGEELRKTFITHLEHALQESSIFAHEGRHVIDGVVPASLRPTNPEYTAKLSEVAFAPEPRLALSNLIGPSIGNSTNHGKANLRVMKGIVKWMSEKKGEIAGLDMKRPLLPQADLLTDQQIKAVFRWLDPLAKGK